MISAATTQVPDSDTLGSVLIEGLLPSHGGVVPGHGDPGDDLRGYGPLPGPGHAHARPGEHPLDLGGRAHLRAIGAGRAIRAAEQPLNPQVQNDRLLQPTGLMPNACRTLSSPAS
jgi:hypothetical protein